ncbi:hypothetical protein M514_02013 [Trichuris suis]|uniref:Uncharacterized protein n=1 Tax=Trichuris suis TaxID=68888 RepID=A0A085NJK1_9BILA|nr:hypothetical protein M513_02013 [Trichuris suis]KFD69647.1 hypothetical protein M514_02013 [Trichuris suis]
MDDSQKLKKLDIEKSSNRQRKRKLQSNDSLMMARDCSESNVLPSQQDFPASIRTKTNSRSD